MAGRYQVTAPYVTVKQDDAVRGFYTNAVFEAEKEAVAHLLRKDMVVPFKEPEPEKPKEPSVKDILAAVGEDPEAAAAALEAERAKVKPRTSLIDGLEAVIAAAGDGDPDGDPDPGAGDGDGK